MIATADIGPRIVHLSYRDGPNLLKLVERQVGKTGGDDWRVVGGHRVWYAPEDPIRSYFPDNEMVNFEIISDKEIMFSVSLTPEVEKTLIMRVANNDQTFEIENKISNIGSNILRTASWGITAFIPGGIGFLPFKKGNTFEESLCANTKLSLWDYTNLSDPAFRWHSDCLEIDQSYVRSKQKIGTFLTKPWTAYKIHDYVIIKSIKSENYHADACNYPDQGSNIEVYLDADLLELESLSPWADLLPGESVSHVERLNVLKVGSDCDHKKVIELASNSIT